MSEIQLGLCNPPEPIYLYVRSGEANGESYLWYKFDIDNQSTIPVHQRGLAGYIKELRITQKEYRGKDNLKLDLVVSADEIYIVRTGIETNFAKTLLLSLEKIQDFSVPYLIAVAEGKENVVFGRIYDSAKQRIKAEWNAQADWAGIITKVQAKLEDRLSVKSAGERIPLASSNLQTTEDLYPQNNLVVKQIRSFTKHEPSWIYAQCRHHGYSCPGMMPLEALEKLVADMCVDWVVTSGAIPQRDGAYTSFHGALEFGKRTGQSIASVVLNWLERHNKVGVSHDLR